MTAAMAVLAKNWRVLAELGLALVLLLGWQHVKALKTENAGLRAKAVLADAMLARLNAALEDNRRALEVREAENAKLAADHRTALAELGKVYETDKEACDWAGGDVPDSVLRLLCQ